MVPYGIPPARVNDFYERYSRMRNPDTMGGSRILQVEEAPVNGRPGAVLSELDWKGEPVSRGGIEGPNIVELAYDQIATDNQAPPTTYSARDYGDRTGYRKMPFQAMTGRTNFTPYGTISSRPENEEERVAREWNQLVTQGQPTAEPVIVQQAPDPRTLVNAQVNNRLQRDMAMTPGTPENAAWAEQENARRAAGGLGPLESAYEDFVADKASLEAEENLSKDIYNSVRRQERLGRTEQGRRTRGGGMSPARTSAISPQFAPVLRDAARNIARQMLSGGNPEKITQDYQNLSRSAVNGAPTPMSPEERYQQQQSRESAERLDLGRQGNKRAQTEFEQEQADRKDFQDSLMKWQGAQTEADRNRVIRESPALQKYFGVRVTQDEGISRTDYGVYSDRLRHLEGKSEKDITDEERQEIGFLRGAIGKYTQDEAKRQGITPKETPKEKPLTKEAAQDFLKKAGGDKQKARAMAKEAGYSF